MFDISKITFSSIKNKCISIIHFITTPIRILRVKYNEESYNTRISNIELQLHTHNTRIYNIESQSVDIMCVEDMSGNMLEKKIDPIINQPDSLM